MFEVMEADSLVRAMDMAKQMLAATAAGAVLEPMLEPVAKIIKSRALRPYAPLGAGLVAGLTHSVSTGQSLSGGVLLGIISAGVAIWKHDRTPSSVSLPQETAGTKEP